MRKNRRINELFIGVDYLNIEGRTVKHPALIQYFANLNVNKTRDDIILLNGIDIETNHLTGEMKLLGIYEGNKDTYEGQYRYYTENHLDHLISNIKMAIKDSDRKRNFAYWNSLDAFQILRLFILDDYSESRKADALERYGKISGEYNNKTGEWEVRPVIVCDRGHFVIGIKQAVRDSIQFYIQSKGSKVINTCWGYNVASLFLNGLEKEADASKGGRFDWYSKVDEEAHLVDWDRFEIDDNFRNNIVLKSNELDAKSACALGYEIQKDFKQAFGAYPVSLISQGSHARSAVVAQIEKDLLELGLEEDDLKARKLDDLNSIPIKTHLDNWLDLYPEPIVKDLNLMFTEAYSGGYIEAISFGTAKDGWFADIASAYPAVIQELMDLRESTLEYGEGAPPIIENSYIFIRGLVTIPFGVDYHPITIKHFVNKDTNIRPTGTFRATYTKDERDFVKSIGGSFREEKWTAVITKGKISVLGNVTKKLIALRTKLLKEGSLAEGGVKRTVNSLYGIEFEAVNIHEEIEGIPKRVGYRAGEFWNPLYASIITSRTRIILAKACTEIAKNGGKPILLMTDSITWEGNKEDLPDVLKFSWGTSGIKKVKTLGYFEEPIAVKNIICFGSGRYGFKTYEENKKTGKFYWKYTNKRRGLNIIDVEDPEGVVIDHNFSWENVMKIALHNNSVEIKVYVRSLITAPTCRVQSKKYGIQDLGRIIEQERNVDLVGNTKRLYNPDIFDIRKLAKGLVKTDAIHLGYNMFVKDDYVDGTLPKLRELVQPLIMISAKIRKRITTKKRVKKFYDNNKVDIKKKKAGKYRLARDGGFSATEARKMMTWGYDRIEFSIAERRKNYENIETVII